MEAISEKEPSDQRASEENKKIPHHNPTSSDETSIIKYEGWEKYSFQYNDSHPLINTFGVKIISFFGQLINKLGQLLSIIWLIYWFIYVLIITQTDTLGMKIHFAYIGLMIIIILIGNYLLNEVEYYKDTMCKFCGREYACREFKKPEIKEISTPDSFNITCTSFWKCKYCGHEDLRPEKRNLRAYKGKMNSKQRKDPCKKCGKEKAYQEFRRPDIKESYSSITCTITTTTYYKCKYCGSIYIEVEEKMETIED
ncbi:MAG: hypothetical protein PHV51_04420 [Methanosarcinaceae archaeon]|nr:hypothetical protein [Methanosarcinaceae archaeon]MDD4497383.1 hypothetical protein [Methanosarcinaceae archaeon]